MRSWLSREERAEPCGGYRKFGAFFFSRAGYAGRKLVAVVTLIDVEVAMERDVVFRVLDEGVHLLNEIRVVQSAVLVRRPDEAPLGNRERLAVVPRKLRPKSKTAWTVHDPFVPCLFLPALDFR
jgi:hypothetical protein